MHENILITLTLLLVAGVACQLVAWSLRLPAILFLLLCGFLAGPILGIFNPDTLLGDMLFPVTSLGVAVILFEGALTLRFDEIKGNINIISRLVTVGAVATGVTAAYAAHYLSGAPWEVSMLFGAIVTVTGPTVIMPLLRTVRPSRDVANILRWEGIVIDPIGVILTILVFEYITAHQTGEVWSVLGLLIFSGGILGSLYAFVLSFILRHHILPEFLQKIFILAYVIGVYTICDLIQQESGLLAVTIMGIVLANNKHIHLDEILDFKESLSIIIISSLFLILSARMDMAVFAQSGWQSLLVLLALVLVARPLCIFVSTIGSHLNWRERALMSWIAPRGIIAAAIAPLFALKMEQKGIAGADALTALVFTVIIGTVVIQSLTARALAQFLKVVEPEPTGILIVGANHIGRAIGKIMQDMGHTIILADINWEHIRLARMDGMKTFFGNVVSEHADRNLDLTGIGKLLAISGNPSENALACMGFKREFGNRNIFTIKTEEEENANAREIIGKGYSAPYLLDGNITQEKLSQMVQDGYALRATTLRDEFTYDDFKNEHKGKAVALFALNKKGALIPSIDKESAAPEPGWVIVSLLPITSYCGSM